MTARTPQLLLSMRISGISVHVLFNGIVVQQFDQVEPVRSATRLSGWIIGRSNSLEIRWKPQLVPNGRDRKLAMRVQRVTGDQDVEAAQFDLPAQGPPAGSQTFMMAFEPIEAWSWLRAQAFPSLPPQERSAIVAVLEQIGAAMVRGDAQALIAAQTVQISEQARASGSSSVAALDGYREFLGERLPMIVDPIDQRNLEFELMGDGRIVLVRSQGGHPAIFGRGSAGILAMSPYMAKIGGLWQIVR